ncbi:hypothetical protein [Nocardia arthritidis]|uniref:Mce-associated membrane protein n=1 Tax=Nocardia arthritidis TaxID=228602 RepID=A0A6G9YUD4_9NOCA|nr:hypothetical protein [Nocardia arthritidis]QIS16828.1 hypothetical protein F5544_45125 [Nocardia arthritidis]
MSTDDAATGKDTAITEDTEHEKDTDAAAQSDDAAGEKDAAAAKAEDTAAKSKAEAEDSAAESKAEKSDAADKKGKVKPDKKRAEPKSDAAPARSNTMAVVAAFVAGVLLVGAITAVVVFYLQAKDRSDKLAARDDATSAGCAFGRDIATYDYSKDLDGWINKIKSESSGEFLSQYGDAAKLLKDAMVQAKVKSWSDDVLCGYQSGDKDSGKVLISLTEYRANFTQQGSAPERALLVLSATMKRDGDKWLVDKLESPQLKGANGGLPSGVPVPSGPDQGQPQQGQPAPNQPSNPPAPPKGN